MESFISLLEEFKLCLRVVAVLDATTLRPSAKQVDAGDTRARDVCIYFFKLANNLNFNILDVVFENAQFLLILFAILSGHMTSKNTTIMMSFAMMFNRVDTVFSLMMSYQYFSLECQRKPGSIQYQHSMNDIYFHDLFCSVED